MKILTKQQKKLVEKNLDLVMTAYKQHYTNGASLQTLQELMDLYTSLGYIRTSISCGSCVINFLSTIGMIYTHTLEIEEQNKNIKK